MSWVQKKEFHLNWMGTKKNYCLKNVRQGYGIGAKYADAKDAMAENARKGALHSLDSIPTNVAVPVYTNKAPYTKWGHVLVCDHGKYYEDGKKVNKPNKNFSWGEWINGVHVVGWKDDVKPSSIKVGDSVIVNGCGAGNSRGGAGKTKPFKNQKMKVIDIKNGRYGCNQYNKQGGITGWWDSSQVKKV